MNERDHRITLRQIDEYIGHAQDLCAGRSAADIEADWRLALAFERAMEVIGEAVKRLPDDLKLRYPRFRGALLLACVIS
jgi:uncharacterized protein with HEPN domain